MKDIRDDVAGETNTYGYDALNRLTGWTLNGVTQETYGYDATTGNLSSKAGATLEYNDTNHDHAVTDAGGNDYSYDANGNMITRNIADGPLAGSYTLQYDVENRVAKVLKGTVTVAEFAYDGDGNRVQSTIGGVTTTFVGNYYEVSGSTVTKYYYAGAQRIAMRQGSTVYYLLSDQLGSTTITIDVPGANQQKAEVRYKAWGEIRSTSGTPANTATWTSSG